MEQKTGERIPFLPVLAGLMVLVPLLIAAGCTGNPPPPPVPPLDGTRWVLTGFLTGGTVVQPLDNTTITLEFGNDTRITGSAGCNHYFAPYEMKGAAVSIGQAGSTLMYCTGPGVMEQESAYLALLGRAVSVTATNDTLIFADATGMKILSFARMAPPEPFPLVGTNWTLDSMHTDGSVSSVITGTTITALFDKDGRVSGSAGCNRYFASYTQTGASIAISSVGSTKMHCTRPGIMQQESTYLASLGRTTTFTIAGSRLVLVDPNGSVLLSYTGVGIVSPVTLSYQPKQCEKTVWQVWEENSGRVYIRAPTGEEILRHYYSAVYGIDVEDVKKIDHGQAACEACYVCPQPYRFELSVNPDRMRPLLDEGWTRTG
jgi:heat shock protein HslJ